MSTSVNQLFSAAALDWKHWDGLMIPEQQQLKKSNECPICSGAMVHLFDMPRMPVAGIYEPWTEPFNDRSYVDQSFLYCEGCSHGKLETIVPPAVLYGPGYRTVSANSVGAVGALGNFAAFITKHLNRFECVIDIGGNDGSLLSLFPGKRRISIDPNASGDYELIREFIENADLDFLKGLDKLICCSHTLEHIENPNAMFEKLRKVVHYGDNCAFQFPSLDYLVKDCRIDQIYHEHIHYYSLRSASLLLAKYGFEIVEYEFDATHYGALMVIFRKGLEELKGEMIEARKITWASSLFREQAGALNDRLESSDRMIGYGASLMLPLLKYYLPAIESLEYVVDEDATKHVSRWTNLNLEIRPGHDMAGIGVMVTAFNTKMAVRRIVEKLFAAKAQNVIVPFNFL